MARNNHSRRRQASKKGASSSSPPTPQSLSTTNTEPAKPVHNHPPPMSYADSLLPVAERAKRHELVAAQKAQMTRVNENPEEYQEKMKDLERTTPDISGGLNQAAIDEWTDFIFNKMEERDDDDEDHNPEDYL